VKMIRDEKQKNGEEMEKKNEEIESLKEQLREKDIELRNAKKELEDKEKEIAKKNAKFLYYARVFDGLNGEIQNEKVVTDFLRSPDEPSGSKDTNANPGAKKGSEADDPQQPAEPLNEYGGSVKYDNTRRESLPRASRMRAKRPRECSEAETDGGTSRHKIAKATKY